jgi:ABC-type Zn uptake system ZnuABC Zn-binding protein ZnuA
MNTKRGLGAAAVVLALLPVGCSSDKTWPDDARPKVVVSFAPIYCFAANVAGDDAVVKNIMTTTGPHDFQPTDTEARLIRRANLFFLNGVGLDTDVAEKLKTGSGNQGLKLVDLSSRLPAGTLMPGECHHAHKGDHEHGDDPHIWLSPDVAVVMVEGIRDELKAADPAHAADYDRRAAEYVAKLRALKARGQELLKDKTDRKLVTFHESLGYFAKAFDLKIEGVVQKKPGLEPNSDELNQLIQMCRDKRVRLIAVEPQYNANTSAKTVLDEVKRKGLADAALVVIDPLETVEPAALTPGWYEEKMLKNLEALAGQMK